MNNWRLRTKLLIALVVPLVLLVVVAAAGTLVRTRVASAFEEVAGVNLPLVTALEEVKFAGSRIISSTNEWVLNEVLGVEEDNPTESSELGQIEAAQASYHTNITVLEGMLAAGDADDMSSITVIENAGQ